MRRWSDSRNVAGTDAMKAVASREIMSIVVVPETARPNRPIAVGTMLALSFGLTLVVHSPSARERETCVLRSIG
jgi:hypothetical protein